MNEVVIVSEGELATWRRRIESAWKASVQAVIEVGILIKQAKEDLGVSYSLLETELPFSSTVAAYLIKIAENPVLSNPTYHSKLPNGYNTLYYLASVEEEKLVEQIEKGEVTPNFSLASAKSLRDLMPKKQNKRVTAVEKRKNQLCELGTISIVPPEDFVDFKQDLDKLLVKYGGKANFTHKDNSIADRYRLELHKKACEMIKASEAELNNISYDEVRMLEDAAHYLSKSKNQDSKAELVLNGELVVRTCLPEGYKDLDKIRKLLGAHDITRGLLKKWCVENKVPNQFTQLSSMDKKLYVWEQVRLITERKDIKGGTKNLKNMASHSTIPDIKELSKKLLADISQFDN